MSPENDDGNCGQVMDMMGYCLAKHFMNGIIFYPLVNVYITMENHHAING
jgi:hypothetical protein